MGRRPILHLVPAKRRFRIAIRVVDKTCRVQSIVARNSYALPLESFVPDFVVCRDNAPEVRPYSVE